MAWWNGYDADELAAYLSGDASEESQAEEAEDVSIDVGASEPEEKIKYWGADRIKIIEDIWGVGFLGPGGEEMTNDIVKPFGLNPEHSVLDISAQLGGAPIVISEKFDVWLTGLQIHEDLVEATRRRVSESPVHRKVKIEVLDRNRPKIAKKAFDRILAKDCLYLVEKKALMLKALHNAMRLDGQITIIDYVLPDDNPVPGAVQKWMEAENDQLFLSPKTVYPEYFDRLKLDMRIQDNISEQYHKEIINAFQQFTERLGQKKATATEEQMAILMHEAELWARRAALLESGEIMAYRYFAIKTPEAELEGT